MPDSQLFNLTNNPNPSLAKNIAFGDTTSEENMTLQQHINLISANVLIEDTWHEMGMGLNWSAASGIDRPGIFYRKNKIGQLEMTFSCSHSATTYNQNITASALPVEYRPSYNRSALTNVGKENYTTALARMEVLTNGYITLSLQNAFSPELKIVDCFIIPL